MKRLVAAGCIFITVLLLGYLQPAVFPMEKPAVKQATNERVTAHKALPYEKIKTAGYAQYVGETSAKFIDTFGEPINKQSTNLGDELWIYGQHESDYVEVTIRNNVVAAIKAFNDSKKIQPFMIGMTLSDVSEQMTIFSNFTFSYNDETFSVELMEEDMNFRPLIAFDNQTFAILFFDHVTGKLAAVTYLNKEMLLTLMPYQLVDGEALPIIQTSMQPTVDAIKSTQAVYVMNLLRKRESLPVYTETVTSQKNAQGLFSVLEKNRDNVLSRERMETWANSTEQATADHSFTLSNDEFQKLLKIGQLNKKVTSGMYTEPVYDPTFTLLSWYSDSSYNTHFGEDSEEEIGIAFSKESMLVLLQEPNTEISQTEDSDY